jgi:hypothetical protein
MIQTATQQAEREDQNSHTQAMSEFRFALAHSKHQDSEIGKHTEENRCKITDLWTELTPVHKQQMRKQEQKARISDLEAALEPRRMTPWKKIGRNDVRMGYTIETRLHSTRTIEPWSSGNKKGKTNGTTREQNNFSIEI